MRILQLAKVASANSLAVAVLALGLAAAVSSPSASAQSKTAAPHQRILGYQDAQTGIFHPLIKEVPDTTITPTTGTIELTITITLKTAVPTGGSVYCTTEIDATSTNEATFSGLDYIESSYSVAKVTGSTATCTVTTPYSWLLPAASATQMNSLSSTYSIGILPASVAASAISELDGRSSTAPFGGTTIPAAGATTKYTVSATL